MAKVILSALLDGLKGKLSGSVFQNTVGGLQMRSWASPRNPATTKQQTRRANWSLTALNWNTLTPSQIASWNDNAPPTSSGIAFYLQTNTKIRTASQAAISEYQFTADILLNSIGWNELTTTSLKINVDNASTQLTAEQYLNLFATVSLPPGTSFISTGTYVYLLSIPPGTATNVPIDITDSYINSFGLPEEGAVIGIRAYIINVIKGISSPTRTSQDYVIAP